MKRILYTLLLLSNVTVIYAQTSELISKNKNKALKEKLIKLAQEEMSGLNYAYAIPLYKDYIRLDKTNGEVYKNLGIAYYMNNQYDSSLKYYLKAANLNSNTENKIPELYAMLEDYSSAVNEYKKLFKNSNSTITRNLYLEQRIKGFSNINIFKNDSLDYSIYNTIINTPYDDYAQVMYKEGLVFESNRSVKINNKTEFGWDGAGFSKLYYLPNLTGIRTDSIQKVKWWEKKIVNAIDDLTKATSNDNNTASPLYDFRKLQFKTAPVVEFNLGLEHKFNQSTITFTADGSTAYFTKNQDNAKGLAQLEIWETHLKDGKWGAMTKLFFNKNEYSYFHPCVTPNGKRLYYVSDEIGGIGGTDIYYVDKNEDGSWKSTTNAGQEINTPGNELYPTFYDNKLYFSSNGRAGLGGLDIYRLDRISTNNFEVVHLPYPINTSKDDFSLTIKGKSGFISSNRYGSDDILAFDYVLSSISIKGQVFLNDTCSPHVKAVLYQNNSDGGIIALDSALTDANCFYTFKVRPNKNYTVIAKYNDGRTKNLDLNSGGYLNKGGAYEKLVDLININTPKPAEVIVENVEKKSFKMIVDSLKALTKNYAILHHNFDRNSIAKVDAKKYQSLLNQIRKLKGATVVIVSAADCNGSDGYNEKLSLRRAMSLSKVVRKISKNQTVIYNVGERQLVADCVVGQDKDGQVINRYSYMFIMKK